MYALEQDDIWYENCLSFLYREAKNSLLYVS